MKRKLLQNLIDKASVLGSPDEHVKTSQEFLEYNESGLCFETLMIQLCEHEVEIDADFYDKAKEVANKMKVSVNEFEYIKELLNSGKK